MWCRVFSSAIASGGVVKAMRIPQGKQISNARIKPKGDISGELASRSTVNNLKCLLTAAS